MAEPITDERVKGNTILMTPSTHRQRALTHIVQELREDLHGGVVRAEGWEVVHLVLHFQDEQHWWCQEPHGDAVGCLGVPHPQQLEVTDHQELVDDDSDDDDDDDDDDDTQENEGDEGEDDDDDDDDNEDSVNENDTTVATDNTVDDVIITTTKKITLTTITTLTHICPQLTLIKLTIHTVQVKLM